MNNAYPIKTCVYQYQSDTGKGSPDDPIQAYSESGEYYRSAMADYPSFWRKTARWTFKIWRIRRAFCAPA
ncbi:hypothetical protein BN1095_4310001 [Clostridioides difficile]|uniref:Uncharacterized protein n=1 Tax=Clostridioides difficile TaxID=1496 RepID=A0A069APU6_CLODI|nr:hypothetical protein BN1095_4310001 [Clostridioides difficile]